MKSLFRVKSLPFGASTGLLLLRVVAGVAFVLHGKDKIADPFGWMGAESGVPGVLQALAAVAEFGGGLAWIAGLLVPLASFGLACTMAVAAWLHAVVLGDPFVAGAAGGASYELAALYFCVALLLTLAGPGRFSLDLALFGSRDGRKA